jgi:hypothetical protein
MFFDVHRGGLMVANILGSEQTIADRRRGSGSFASDGPRWFIIALGLAYATGFLIVSTFLNSFGAQISSDVLRLKYLQVGFFFILFFGSITGLTISIRKGLEQRQAVRLAGDGKKKGKPDVSKDALEKQYADHYPVRIAVWVNVVLQLYLAVGFAPPHSGPRVLPPATCLLAVAIMGTNFIYQVEKKYAADNKDLYMLIERLRQLLLLALLPIDGWMLWTFKTPLLELLRHSWLYLLVLIGLLGVIWYLIYGAFVRRSDIGQEEHKTYMWSRVALGVPIYYLCVLTFTYGVYPYMSPSRGGGYYLESGRVRLMLRQQNGNCREEFVTSGSLCISKDLVLLDEGTNSTFVADPADPLRTEGIGGIRCWADFACRPKVMEIKINELVYIEHLPKFTQ